MGSSEAREAIRKHVERLRTEKAMRDRALAYDAWITHCHQGRLDEGEEPLPQWVVDIARPLYMTKRWIGRINDIIQKLSALTVPAEERVQAKVDELIEALWKLGRTKADLDNLRFQIAEYEKLSGRKSTEYNKVLAELPTVLKERFKGLINPEMAEGERQAIEAVVNQASEMIDPVFAEVTQKYSKFPSMVPVIELQIGAALEPEKGTKGKKWAPTHKLPYSKKEKPQPSASAPETTEPPKTEGITDVGKKVWRVAYEWIMNRMDALLKTTQEAIDRISENKGELMEIASKIYPDGFQQLATAELPPLPTEEQ